MRLRVRRFVGSGEDILQKLSHFVRATEISEGEYSPPQERSKFSQFQEIDYEASCLEFLERSGRRKCYLVWTGGRSFISRNTRFDRKDRLGARILADLEIAAATYSPQSVGYPHYTSDDAHLNLAADAQETLTIAACLLRSRPLAVTVLSRPI